jgi:hypothetical protein
MFNTNKSCKFRHRIFLLILSAYILYAILFICRTSFKVGGVRYYCLFDDAMISMTYARNLAHGYGLVWNPAGERAEGFTNLLWVIYMALFHLLPIAQSKISLFIQASGALSLALNCLFVKRIASLLSEDSMPVAAATMTLTAFYLPLNNWALQGMEVGALTLLISMTVLEVLKNLKTGGRSLLPFLLLGLASLIRIDLFASYVVVLLFLIISDPKNRRYNLITGLAILLISALSQTLFRLFYYGDWLPNTYYLKVSGVPLLLRMERGLVVLALFIWKINWVFFLIAFLPLILRKNKTLLLPAALIMTQMAYSVYVGGDSWDWWGGSNRFISIIMPIFFILFACGTRDLTEIITGGMGWKKSNTLFATLILGALVNFNAISGPAALAEWLLIKKPLHVEDNQEKVREALLLKRITRKEARIAVTWGGIPIYFSERQGVDLLGKNDRVIARQKMRPISGIREFNPGHLKRDYAYSIGQLRPDVVAELGRAPEEAEPFLKQYYDRIALEGFSFYLLKGSQNITFMPQQGACAP